MMLVPDPRDCDSKAAKETREAVGDMGKRKTLPLSEELELPDRIALDSAVLKLLGYTDANEREAVKAELCSEMRRIHRDIRQAEIEMQKFRRITARQGRASPRTIAEEIWEEFDKTQIRPFPSAFLVDGEPTETAQLPAGKPKVLDNLFDRGAVQINGTLIQLGSKARAEFAAKTVELGHYGPIPIPKNDRACQRALEAYQRYESQMDATFRELAEERSADPETQSRIVHELWKLLRAWSRTEG
jgi:hypothetical protein